MKHPKFKTFASADELAAFVAREWLDEVALAIHAGRPHRVALSGGRITLKFFAAVIESAEAQDLSLPNVDFFWADERCVPPTDPESNFAAASKFFFQPLGIAEHRIHRVRGESTPEMAAWEAETEIRRLVPPDPTGQPMLDLIFLGLGEDGHVASLFPNEPEATRADPSVYRVVRNSPKPPPNRITLGYAAIRASHRVWVLASGAGKETALRESLDPNGQTPLARVIQAHSQVTIFSDIRAD